jgi:hypothetical protein
VSPLRDTTRGELKELESSIWISYVAAPATAFQEKVMLWFNGSLALFAGLTKVGAAGGTLAGVTVRITSLLEEP